MSSTYKEIPALIQARMSFVGNSSRGISSGSTYEIWSYEPLIATYGPAGAWLNATKYSVTTSKLQNIIRRAWAL
jgi:hypothetical protein